MTALVASRPIATTHESLPSFKQDEDDGMNIFFRFVDGKNVSLLVNSDTEIQTMKEMLVQKVAAMSSTPTTTTTTSTNNALSALACLWFASVTASYYARFHYYYYNPNNLFLICNGKPLDEDCCVRDYYYGSSGTIKDGSTVHVSVRRKGGCFMISASVLGLICTAIVGSTCTCGLSLLAVPILLPLLFVLPLFCL